MKKRILKQAFESAVMEYVNHFCIKHNFVVADCSWVCNRVGEVLEVADYYFGFEDIRLDIDQKLPNKTIFKWYDATLEHAYCPEHHNINLDSWVRGLRYAPPMTRTQRLIRNIQTKFHFIHWRFVGKRQMTKRFNDMMEEFT